MALEGPDKHIHVLGYGQEAAGFNRDFAANRVARFITLLTTESFQGWWSLEGIFKQHDHFTPAMIYSTTALPVV